MMNKNTETQCTNCQSEDIVKSQKDSAEIVFSNLILAFAEYVWLNLQNINMGGAFAEAE